MQKWEQAFANLEEDEQRRIVSTAAESGLLQAIQMSRAALMRYERAQRRCGVNKGYRMFRKEARRWLADSATCAA